MIKVYVEASELYGPVVTAIKGTRSAAEWITREIERALCFRCDGTLTVDWATVSFPADLRKRINIIQLSV